MRSKVLKGCIALALCMVIALGGSEALRASDLKEDISGDEPLNQWQIVNGQYPENQKTTEDQALRIRKNVVPTDVENEFYMYLSIEPMMDWKTVIDMISIWVVNSRNSIQNGITEEDAQNGNFGGASHYSKVCNTPEEAYQSANNPTGCNKLWTLYVKYHIYDADGNIKETITKTEPMYVYMQAGANWTELVRFPFDELYSKYESDFQSNGDGTGTITFNITQEHLGDNYEFLEDKVIVDQVEDPVGDAAEGDYILYEGELNLTSSSANYNSVEDKIYWNQFTEIEPSVDFTDYEKVQLPNGKYTYYRKSAYEMCYKIRLDVEKEGFYSCAEELFGDVVVEEAHYHTNGTTPVSYHMKESGVSGSDTFPIPVIRGLLYNVAFRKVDDAGKALAGAEFTISEITKVSDENGDVKFSNMPWGTYTITETKVPEGYTGAEEFQTTLCYTTNPELLERDGDDVRNMIYKKENLPNGGEIINIQKTYWQIIKQSSGEDGRVLEGAEFTLSRQEQSLVYYGKTQEQGILQWYMDAQYAEPVEMKDIEAGTYILKERIAPVGYSCSSEEWTMTFAEKGASPVVTRNGDEEVQSLEETIDGAAWFTYTFENTPLYDIPSTGGSGFFWYKISGILLFGAAVLVLYKSKCIRVYPGRKERRI